MCVCEDQTSQKKKFWMQSCLQVYVCVCVEQTYQKGTDYFSVCEAPLESADMTEIWPSYVDDEEAELERLRIQNMQVQEIKKWFEIYLTG